MNRRVLLRSVSASAFVLAANRLNALAQPTETDREYESALTGSVVALTDQQWGFNPDQYAVTEEPDYTREHFSVTNQSSIVEIDFIQTEMTPEDFLIMMQGVYESRYDGFELADSGTTADGAWFAASVLSDGTLVSVYSEYQAGAYETADLSVTVNTLPEELEANLDAAQTGITVGDLEPFVWIQDSDVLALTFPAIAATTTTRTTRTTRSTNTGNTTETTRTTRTNRGSTTSGSSTYVDDVTAHREEFLASFAEFMTQIAVAGDATATEADLAAALAAVDLIAETWTGYADRAAGLTAPAELGQLEDVYLQWADDISALGGLWAVVRMGETDVEVVLDQIEVVNQIDQELEAELAAAA